MRYRIEYADGQSCNFANGRDDLLIWLKLLKFETITGIWKEYKNGESQSVMERYAGAIERISRSACEGR